MKTYVYDIEGDGLCELWRGKNGKLIREVSTVHCLVLRSWPDGETKVYRNNDDEDTIAEGVAELCSADVTIGHNILQYDSPALARLYPDEFSETREADTLCSAKLLWPDAKGHPFGGNGVDDFGKRLGIPKVGMDITDWSAWTQEMEDRCIRDTEVQHRIFDFLKPKVAKFRSANRLEHRVAKIIQRQQQNGVNIDIPAAEELIDYFDLERAKVLDHLRTVFPDKIVCRHLKGFYWKDPETGRLYETKAECDKPTQKRLVKSSIRKLRWELEPFNPGSSKQVAERLRWKYAWDAPLTKPNKDGTGGGNPSVKEDVLKSLPFLEADKLLHYGMADMRLGHLHDWTERARSSRTPGRIHPFINTNGTIAGRMSHQQPNQTACPKVLDPTLRGYAGRYGWEMRALWGPRDGWLMVGADASGLELRMLGAMLARYDGGAYAREVVSGDVHTLNQKAGGLTTRDQAKTVIYAYLYGAGLAHIGFVIDTHLSLSPEQVAANGRRRDEWVKKNNRSYEDYYAYIGRKFRKTFEHKIPALSRLVAWCRETASEHGYITLADGRHVPTRAEHVTLNNLLQGNGAIMMKLALVMAHDEFVRLGWMWDKVAFMLNAHDEIQTECEPGIEEEVGQVLVDSIIKAGETFKFACPMDGEYKIGPNWAETH